MDSPCAKQVRKKYVLLLIFCIACMVLPGYSRKPKAKKEKDNPTLKLERAIQHFQEGNSLYGQKKLDEAIAEYCEALQGDSEEPYWHQALGKALEDKGDLQGALKEDRVAAKQSPLDSGLRSKYEELAKKLNVNIQNKPAQLDATGREPFAVGGDVAAPVPTSHPEPAYPSKAPRSRFKGTTVLSIVVDAQGNVTDTQVVKPLGVGFDEKALEAVRKWKFKPGTRGGVAVPARVIVQISFRTFL